jgi:hypothetical protein
MMPSYVSAQEEVVTKCCGKVVPAPSTISSGTFPISVGARCLSPSINVEGRTLIDSPSVAASPTR